jgi:hypothetical protein
MTPVPEPTDHADEVDRDAVHRRDVLARLGSGATGMAAAGLLLGGSGGALVTGLWATAARADTALDLQILQTASSVERLAIDIYDALLAPGAVARSVLEGATPPAARDALVGFLTTTRGQHADHLRAFQAQTTALGGTVQDAPNPRFRQAMTQQLPGLVDLQKLLDFGAALEKLATDTYLSDLAQLQDRRTKEILASVMAVEAQHLGAFRALGALVASPQLIVVPFPQAGIAKLPGTVCSLAFPDALHRVAGADGVAEPSSGAVG